MSENTSLPNRFGSGRLFQIIEPGNVSPENLISELPEVTTAQNNLKSGFKDLQLNEKIDKSEEISEYLQSFGERFTGFRYWYESRSKRAVLSKDGNTVEEKSVEEVKKTEIIWDKNQYLYINGERRACEKAISIIREMTDEAKFREIVFGSEFLTWMFYKCRESEPLRREFSLQRITDLEFVYQGNLRQMNGVYKSSGMENSLPAMANVLQGAEITRLNGEFEVAGYSVNGNIWQGERVGTVSGGSLSESSDLRRLLVSLRFIHEISDLYLAWKAREEDERHPPTDFYYDLYQQIEEEDTSFNFSFEETPVKQSSPIRNRDTIVAETEAKIIDAEIEEILQKGETETVEFKKELPPHHAQIAKEVVALANRKGGVVVLGVDDNGEVVGIPDRRTTEETISNILANSVKPRPNVQIEFTDYNTESLLIIRVGQFQTLPHAVDYTFYTRLGTTKRKLTPYELSFLMPDRE